MKVEDFLKTYQILTKQELHNMLKEYATIQCNEQRNLIEREFDSKVTMAPDNYSSIIENTPYPKF